MQLIHGLLLEPALLEEVVAPLRAGGGGELLPEIGERDLVNLDQRLALSGAFTLLAGRFHLGDRNAEPRREVAHRLLEIHLLLQLDELEHVAAHAAAEQWKKPRSRMTLNDGVFSP